MANMIVPPTPKTKKIEKHKDDPFNNWQPELKELARASYLEYAEHLADGAAALHTLEVALTTACKALPAVYSMVIPTSLGSDAGSSCLEGRGTDEAEELLVPVFSQLPLLLRKVRDAAEHTDSVVWRQVNCASDDCPALAYFVRENTRLPQVLELGKKWSADVWNAANRGVGNV